MKRTRNSVPRNYEIRGNLLKIFYYNGTNKVMLKQKMLSPNGLKLWFKISDGEFDEELWNQINDDEQKFLINAHRLMRFPENRLLEIGLSKKTINLQNRLKLLEGNIRNGNVNKDILDEATKIIDELKDMTILSSYQASRYKTRLNALYTNILETQE